VCHPPPNAIQKLLILNLERVSARFNDFNHSTLLTIQQRTLKESSHPRPNSTDLDLTRANSTQLDHHFFPVAALEGDEADQFDTHHSIIEVPVGFPFADFATFA